jgi:hypothetical protein
MGAWTRMHPDDPAEATAAVGTARALGTMPATAAALAGDIDPAHARALAAGATDTRPGRSP